MGDDGAPAALQASGEAPRLTLHGFDGPLDFLLEMVRRHQVDLGRLSIITLTDQLVAALESSTARLERRADWLVMATELLRLRAQLIAPVNQHAAEEAEAEAKWRLGQLEELATMKEAAAWLASRPQLGVDVFARSKREPTSSAPLAELYVAFLEATLVMLEGREGSGDAPQPAYRPTTPDFWRVPDAMARIRAILKQHPRGGDLAFFLPPLSGELPDGPLRARAALASTFLAGLELAKNDEAALLQDRPFGPINLQ